MLHDQALPSRPSSPPQLAPSSSPSTSAPRSLSNVPPLSTSPRPYSPAPSASSSSSLSSTTSTHTIVPPSPRSNTAHSRYKLGSLQTASLSTASLDSSSTATPRNYGPRKSSTPAPRVQPLRTHPNGTMTRSRSAEPRPSIYALLKETYSSYFPANYSKLSISTFILLLIVFPLVSFFLRRRRRRLLGTAGSSTSTTLINTNAEIVRKRLFATSSGAASRTEGLGLLGKILGTVGRIVGDTVKMGGSGLV